MMHKCRLESEDNYTDPGDMEKIGAGQRYMTDTTQRTFNMGSIQLYSAKQTSGNDNKTLPFQRCGTHKSSESHNFAAS